MTLTISVMMRTIRLIIITQLLLSSKARGEGRKERAREMMMLLRITMLGQTRKVLKKEVTRNSRDLLVLILITLKRRRVKER